MATTFTLSGDLPDDAAKASLLDALRGGFGPIIILTDNLNIKAGVSARAFSGLGPSFNDRLADVSGFQLQPQR